MPYSGILTGLVGLGYDPLQVDEKVSKYAAYIFEPLDTSLWTVAHEEAEMKVVSIAGCFTCLRLV